VVFAGMLELVRDGRVRALQGRPYGEIELEVVTPDDPRFGAASDADDGASDAGVGDGR
jgi:chromatin segregation and condensation protein Rec8/ScpA/Scc1 (kleisin family)